MCATANSTSFYSRFVSDKGHLFYSLIHKESKKFNSTVIEYQTNNNKTAFGVIHSFIKLNTSNKGLCMIYQLNQIEKDFNYIDRIDDEILDNKTQEIVNKYKGKKIVQHQYFVNNAVGSLDVMQAKDIIHKCILIDVLKNLWILSKFPYCIEPHYRPYLTDSQKIFRTLHTYMYSIDFQHYCVLYEVAVFPSAYLRGK